MQGNRRRSENEKKIHSTVTERIFVAEVNSNKRMTKLCKKTRERKEMTRKSGRTNGGQQRMRVSLRTRQLLGVHQRKEKVLERLQVK